MEPVLSARGIVKVYPNGVEANKGVDIDLYPGRVVALLGENGAGKTTLVKVLTGIERPTRGSITFKGAPARFNSPRDAARLGIYMVPQHPTLFNNLRVYEDVGLALASIGRKTPPATVRSIIRELSSRYGLDVDPDADISGLTVGEKQRVEVLKGILIGTSVLFLDEPSTHMTPGEVKSLISLARRLAGEGRSIVYITHRIDEALEAADELLIMRGGRLVARMDAGSASKGEVLRHMFGSVEEVRRTSRRVGGVVLAIEDLWVKSRHGGWALRGVTLSLREGEVLGVAGIAGNGQRELFEAIAGLVKPSRGRIILGGEDVTRLPPRERLRRGLSLIPEERLGWAVVPGKSILYNASIPIASRNGAGILIRGEWIRRVAVRVVESTGVKTASLGDPVDSLSGGNMQRLVVGRELLYRPRSLVAMNITAGLDYRAASRVREMILDAASRGSGILLIDEDLDLLTEVADRIIVLSRGRVTGEFKPPYNIEDIAASMTLG